MNWEKLINDGFVIKGLTKRNKEKQEETIIAAYYLFGVKVFFQTIYYIFFLLVMVGWRISENYSVVSDYK